MTVIRLRTLLSGIVCESHVSETIVVIKKQRCPTDQKYHQIMVKISPICAKLFITIQWILIYLLLSAAYHLNFPTNKIYFSMNPLIISLMKKIIRSQGGRILTGIAGRMAAGLGGAAAAGGAASAAASAGSASAAAGAAGSAAATGGLFSGLSAGFTQ